MPPAPDHPPTARYREALSNNNKTTTCVSKIEEVTNTQDNNNIQQEQQENERNLSTVHAIYPKRTIGDKNVRKFNSLEL